MRKLKLNEVTITIKVEPEDENPRTHFEDDQEIIEQVLGDIAKGHLEAWCSIHVTAQWGSFFGHAHLGCVSLDVSQGRDLKDEIGIMVRDDYQMDREALADLQQKIEAVAAELEQLK